MKLLSDEDGKTKSSDKADVTSGFWNDVGWKRVDGCTIEGGNRRVPVIERVISGVRIPHTLSTETCFLIFAKKENLTAIDDTGPNLSALEVNSGKKHKQ